MLSFAAGLAILLIARVRMYYIGEYERVREYIICRIHRYNIIMAGINLQCCTPVHDYIIIMCAVCAVPVDGID